MSNATQATDGTKGHRIGLRVGMELQNVIEEICKYENKSQNIFRGDVISFPVSIKNYNDLRANNCDPAILIVIHLPEDPTEWIMYQDQKILQAEGYYYSLRGLPQLQNSSSVTLTIPKTNTFTPDTLHDMMTKISRGETI